MNTNHINILCTSIVQAGILFCLGISLLFTGCAKKKVEEEKIISRGFLYMAAPRELILQIDKEGIVTVGEWDPPAGVPFSWWKDSAKNVGTGLMAYPGHRFTLEGPARVGDPFRFRLYYKEVLLGSGEMKRTLEKITVESDKMEEYKRQMASVQAATPAPK